MEMIWVRTHHDYCFIIIRTLTSQQRGPRRERFSLIIIIIACDADSKKEAKTLQLNFSLRHHKEQSHLQVYHIFNRTEGIGHGASGIDLGTWQILIASNQPDILHRSRALTALKVIE